MTGQPCAQRPPGTLGQVQGRIGKGFIMRGGWAAHTEPDGGDGRPGSLLLEHLLHVLGGLAHLRFLTLGELEVRSSLLGCLRLCAGREGAWSACVVVGRRSSQGVRLTIVRCGGGVDYRVVESSRVEFGGYECVD